MTSALVSPHQAHDIVLASLAHLVRLVQRKGRFIYAHDAGNTSATFDGYNLLRHCGTLWFMARATRITGGAPEPDVIEAMRRAVGYIGDKLAPAPWAAPDRPSLALVSKGAVKLGGLGLALLAFGEADTIPALRPHLAEALPLGLSETISRMRQYALDEIDDDDFSHKRNIETGAVLPFRSDYYTGEAIFGLLTTGPAPDDLTRVITALLHRRYGWAEQSHWMAYSACEATERGIVPQDLGATYLSGLMQAILSDSAYRQRRQSTPIACRSEALTRVLMLSRRLPGLLSPDLLDRVRAHAAENLRIQLDWYQDGQFWKGDDERKVQIDYIQHNATAFLHWAMLEG